MLAAAGRHCALLRQLAPFAGGVNARQKDVRALCVHDTKCANN